MSDGWSGGGVRCVEGTGRMCRDSGGGGPQRGVREMMAVMGAPLCKSGSGASTREDGGDGGATGKCERRGCTNPR